MSSKRVTGHLKLVERREGSVWYAKTRVPGRTPEQTTRRLAPAHLGGGRPPAGHLTRRQAQDVLDEIIAVERSGFRRGAYEQAAVPVTFAEAAAGFPAARRARQGPRVLHRARLPPEHQPVLEPALGRAARRTRSCRATSRTCVDELMTAGLSARTVVRHLTVAHGVFKHAMRAHDLPRNPASAELVDRPTVRYSGEFVTFDADEVAALAPRAR